MMPEHTRTKLSSRKSHGVVDRGSFAYVACGVLGKPGRGSANDSSGEVIIVAGSVAEGTDRTDTVNQSVWKLEAEGTAVQG
jgi:hypothetical protein